ARAGCPRGNVRLRNDAWDAPVTGRWHCYSDTSVSRLGQGPVIAMQDSHARVYAAIAARAGLPGRARLVGKLLGEVPDGVELPWFRVLRASGEIALPKGSR